MRRNQIRFRSFENLGILLFFALKDVIFFVVNGVIFFDQLSSVLKLVILISFILLLVFSILFEKDIAQLE